MNSATKMHVCMYARTYVCMCVCVRVCVCICVHAWMYIFVSFAHDSPAYLFRYVQTHF